MGHQLFKQWEADKPENRSGQLHEIAKLFHKHSDQLAKAMVTDMGKLYREAKEKLNFVH